MERGFWFSLTLAMILWIVTKIGLLSAQIFEFSDGIYLVANYGYFAFFLCFLFALQLLSSPNNANKDVTFSYSHDQWLALTFMGFMFLYLIVISPQNPSQEQEYFYSSFIFYLTMDVFLLCICIRQSANSELIQWRKRLYWFAITFILFLILDLMELLIRTQQLSLDLQGIVALFWHFPYITLLIGISINEDKDKPIAAASYSPFRGSGPLLAVRDKIPEAPVVLLISLPVIHFTGYQIEILAPESKDARELILIIWILIYAGYLYLNPAAKTVSANKTPSDSSHSDIKLTEQNNDLVEHVLTALPFPCFLLNDKGRIRFCNQTAVDLFGYQESELVDSHFSGLLDKNEPLTDLLRYSETCLSDSQLFTNSIREVHCHHRNGQKLFCYIAFGKTDLETSLVTMADITSLHDAEVQALSIKDKFLANITHEFRTPLTIIQGVIDEGLDNEPDGTFHSRLVAAKSNSVRVLKMVEQLLNLSKITSAPKLDFSAQPASQIIFESCRQFENLCQYKNIQFVTNIDKDIWIMVHEDALQQVLYNLLSNAYKYSDCNSKINVVAKVVNSNLHLTISDTGHGMNQEEQSRLFERFQRADAAKSSSTFGVGIGLSLVSELVASHEWRITVDSKLNVGTHFNIEIPVSNSSGTEAQTSTSNDYYAELSIFPKSPQQLDVAANTTQYDANKGANKLLVIEDNPDMQDHLTHLLSPHYQVDVRGTGKDGISAAMEDIPDLIVCDLMLPDIFGFDVVEQLKNHELTQHIPIIMLTAKADNQSKLTGLEKQADDYLTKPFDHRELKLRIDNLLSLREKIQGLLRGQLSAGRLPQQAEPGEEAAQFQALPHQKFLDKLQLVAGKQYADEEFNTSKLAANMHLSERQLQRKLKAALDITPGEYIREFRLIKARGLLKSGMSVGQVAEAVGFSSQNYFARCFKIHTGKTPSDFQRNLSC